MPGLFFTFTRSSRSPPLFPLPLNLILLPSSIPAGIETYYETFFVSIPLPLHVVHGFVIFCPYPLQELHAVRIAIMPCLNVIYPLPLHEVHFSGLVPGFDLEPLHVPHTPFF